MHERNDYFRASASAIDGDCAAACARLLLDTTAAATAAATASAAVVCALVQDVWLGALLLRRTVSMLELWMSRRAH